MSLLLRLAERRRLPDPVVRLGIRSLLRSRRRELGREVRRGLDAHHERWTETMRRQPIALTPGVANEQHYEVPAEFFELVLGPALKYSCCWFETGEENLAEAEEAMLQRTAERAGVSDGMEVLDLGCGWGSFSLWAAPRFPGSRFLAISNSGSQRRFIQDRARAIGLRNLEVRTADANDFVPGRSFDRIVSVEMFEHMRNWEELLGRCARWLRPDGRLFLHTFVHDRVSYSFLDRGDKDWMARHFFGAGMMPAADLITRVRSPFEVERRWRVDGRHYRRTAEAWLAQLDRRSPEVTALFERSYGSGSGALWVQRWRLFFMSCAELFGYRGGGEWRVQHALLRPLDPGTGTRDGS